MIWPVTCMGVLVGFALTNIPGALLGGLLGHSLDRRLGLHSWGDLRDRAMGGQFASSERLRFTMLGRLARHSDAFQRTDHQFAREEMHRLALTADEQRRAMSAFEHGHDAEAFIAATLAKLGGQHSEVQGLLLGCWRMLAARGVATPDERALIQRWGHCAGWTEAAVDALTIGLKPRLSLRTLLADARYSQALQLLGLPSGSEPAVIKDAYRRLLSRHHPDKLAGQGASSAQLRDATEMTCKLHSAYVLIREKHGFR